MSAPHRTTAARGLVALLALTGAGMGVATTPVAVGAATTTTTIAAVEIPGGGLSVQRAVVTTPGTAPRTLSPYQSAVFVQAWIIDATFGKPRHEPIPANVTAARVDVTANWGGGSDYFSRPVFYASDGTTAWVVFPNPALVPATGVPKNLDWFVAPPRVIPAFAGKGTLVQVETPTTVGTGSTGGSTGTSSTGTGSSGGSSAWVWIVGAVALVAVVGGGFGLRRRTRRA